MTSLDREILAYCSNHFGVSVDDVASALPDFQPYLVRQTAINLIFNDLLDADLRKDDLMDGSIITPGYIMGLTAAGHEALHPRKVIGFG